MNDWRGNSNSVFKSLGASNHCDEERQTEDFYATSPEAIDILCDVETFDGGIWEPCCVDCDTEYFNGKQWKRISDYTDGDSVLCADNSLNGILLKPYKYHKNKYDGNFYHYKSNNLDMMLTPDHRVVYFHRRKDIIQTKSAYEVFNEFEKDSIGFRGKIPTTFQLPANDELNNINEYELRLAVACNADGRCRTIHKKTYQIRIKKERERERLEYLLRKCNIQFNYKTYDGMHDYTFQSPLGCKHFPQEWVFLPKRLKDAFLDEIYRWDGNLSDGGMRSYFSSKKEDIDVVQMIANSSGLQAKIYTDIRSGYSDAYRIIFKTKTKHAIVKRKHDYLSLEKSSDGYSYCFTVETGILILRKNGKIFITGNCGMGHLSEELIKRGYTVLSTDLIDRGYGIGGVDFLKQNEMKDGTKNIITNPPYSYAQEFVEHSMSLLPDGGKLAMFLKLTFLEGKKRKPMFAKYPPETVYVSSSRILCAKNGDFENAKAKGSAVAYGWYIFCKQTQIDNLKKFGRHITEIKWIN